MTQRWPPVYPMFFAAGWVVFVFAINSAPLPSLWRPLAVVVGFTSIVYAIAFVVVRNRQAAAFAAATASMTALMYWVIALPLWAVAGWWIALKVRRRYVRNHALAPLNFERITHTCQAIGAVFLGLAIANGAVRGAFTWYGNQPSNSALPALAATTRATPTPDIYVILLDGYPSLETTASEFGIDNEPFAQALTGIGFDVYRGAASNYMQTWLTFASMMWMDYVSEIPGLAKPPSGWEPQVRILTKAINEGPALAILRELGYRIVTSPVALTDSALFSADELLDDGHLTQFEERLIKASVLSVDAGTLIRRPIAGEMRAWIESSFNHIPRVLDESGRRSVFYFDHVMSPHPPFLYHEDGSPRDLPACYPRSCDLFEARASALGMSKAEYGEALAEQLAYLNVRILEAVREIVARDPEAVVVLLSDHGTRYDLEDVPENFESFLAARTPGHPGIFGEIPSPVNFMPSLLNAFFGTSFPLRDYRAWVSTDNPLDLREWEPPANAR